MGCSKFLLIANSRASEISSQDNWEKLQDKIKDGEKKAGENVRRASEQVF